MYLLALAPLTARNLWMADILLILLVIGFLLQREWKASQEKQLVQTAEKKSTANLKPGSSEHKDSEEEDWKTEQLTARMQMNTHDINNSLGVMKVSIQLLAREKNNDGDVSEYCRVLLEECERISHIIATTPSKK